MPASCQTVKRGVGRRTQANAHATRASLARGLVLRAGVAVGLWCCACCRWLFCIWVVLRCAVCVVCCAALCRVVCVMLRVCCVVSCAMQCAVACLPCPMLCFLPRSGVRSAVCCGTTARWGASPPHCWSGDEGEGTLNARDWRVPLPTQPHDSLLPPTSQQAATQLHTRCPRPGFLFVGAVACSAQ